MGFYFYTASDIFSVGTISLFLQFQLMPLLVNFEFSYSMSTSRAIDVMQKMADRGRSDIYVSFTTGGSPLRAGDGGPDTF